MFPTALSLRRAAALSIAFAFLTTSVTFAQTPAPAAPGAVTLLSRTAFARLAHAPKPIAPRGATNAPRRDLRLEIGAATNRLAARTPSQTHERSWASRHKVAMAFILAGATAGGIVLVYFGRCGGGSAPNYCE